MLPFGPLKDINEALKFNPVVYISLNCTFGDKNVLLLYTYF